MPEERKLVSVLFADIVGSTALGHENDPEVVREVLGRYFDRVREIVEAHGGTVEKFIGDAAMAVFGVPRVHDDDAERAVRAALAIQGAIGPLNDEVALHLEARVGVNSGEVVAGVDEREQFLVTGDVVNVAARLQQHADAGEVLVGALTAQLTRSAIDYEPRDAIEARGKPEPVAVQRALRPRSEIPDQARGLPGMRARLVGRQRELRLLVDTFERARDDQRPQMFTLVGSAGVGKSRLIGEFLARISGAEQARLEGVVTGLSGSLVKVESATGDASRLTVLRGRCLPYGTAITYWPLLELVQADLGVTLTDQRTDVVARLDARLAALIPDARSRAAVRARLAVLLGIEEPAVAMPDVGAARRAAELGAGLGAYLEAIAATGPLVVVVDDLQWADPAVLEIMRVLLDRVVDVPLVAACIARPELLEREPTWGAGRQNATTIVLEPLSGDETRTLIARLLDIDDLPEALRGRIVMRSEGNPLFVEEFVRMLIEEGRLVRDEDRWRAAGPDSLDVRVPESIQALIAARLDALTAAEKDLLHAASVVGEEWELAQVVPLVADRAATSDLVAPLVRRGVIVPNRHAGPDGYRFRHLLIRDVAYATLPKAERARLHEAFGRHLEADAIASGRRDELIEILAHHAERALALSTELRLGGASIGQRARRALDLAFESAARAVDREDVPAAASFLGHVSAAMAALGDQVTPAEQIRRRLLDGQVAMLRPDYPSARVALREAAELADAAGAHAMAGAAWRGLANTLVQSMESDEFPQVEAAIERARRAYDAAGDVRGRLAVDVLALEQEFSQGLLTSMIDSGLRLADEALAIGDRPRAAATWARLVSAAGWHGRGDLAEELATRALALADELGLGSTRRWVRFWRARVSWLRGDSATSIAVMRELIAEGEVAVDLANQLRAMRLLGEALLDSGELDEAGRVFGEAIEGSIRTGDRWSRTELYAYRAEVRLRQGDLAAARDDLAASEATLRMEDVAAVSVYHAILGKVLAAEGRDEEAEASLRRALETGRATEYCWWTMDGLNLAEFLVSRGRIEEASALIAEVDRAVRRFGYGLRRDRIDAVLARVAVQPA